MKVIDKKFVTLNNNGEEIKVVVYLKEVGVRSGGQNVRAFCKTIDPKKIDEFRMLME